MNPSEIPQGDPEAQAYLAGYLAGLRDHCDYGPTKMALALADARRQFAAAREGE